MKISIFGTGYVGLVTGTCFAELGNDVICVDVDPLKVENLKKGIIPIYEPGLENLVHKNYDEKRLTFTINASEAIKNCTVLFIAVGTPSLANGNVDMSYVEAVAREIGRHIQNKLVIVNKSTVPIGTHLNVAQWIAEEQKKRSTNFNFSVVSNPEFLKEGSAIEDFMRPDRVVIGADDPEAAQLMLELYQPLVRTNNPILVMDTSSAEMTKYAANAMLATRISFMNEIAAICERTGANVDQVRKGIGFDSRIGQKFLFPGSGYGGSCFPKDVKGLISKAIQVGIETKILDSVEAVNKKQKVLMFEKMKLHYGEQLKNKTVAIWGLAFKPNTDDCREAPSLVLVNALIDAGCNLRAFDPIANESFQKMWGKQSSQINFFESRDQVLLGADCLLIITEWNDFRMPNFEKILELKDRTVFDGRNIMDPNKMKKLGLKYFSIGRPNV